jgi:hypothetical protein
MTIAPAIAQSKEVKEPFWLRGLCFLLCAPSIAALLAKVYGVASMQSVAVALALPACALLVVAWAWAERSARSHLAAALVIGFVGGLAGTIAYDLARVPFHLAGQRIFAPISIYGVWIADASVSSRFTEVLGWSYHFSNGITFGIMYTLFMRRRHWGWAVLWGCLLETGAILSPFAQIFNLSGNYYGIGIAYLGHVAYGLPLGYLAYKWDTTRSTVARVPAAIKLGLLILGAAALASPLLSPDRIEQDATAAPNQFRVDGYRLSPDYLRINRGETVEIANPGAEAATLLVKKSGETAIVGANDKGTLLFQKTGIYQVHVQTAGRSQSSFVIVEPVESLE